MAKWNKNKVDSGKINSGNEFVAKDNLAVNELNAIVNNSFYASNIAENVANQLASLAPNDKIEFKGSNPNLLINGDFRINQRGQISYSGYVYGLDRWIGNTGTIVEPQANGGVKLTRTVNGNGMLQRVEDWANLVGKTMTLSVKFSEVISGSARCTIYTGTTYTGTTVSTSGGISTLTFTVPTNATRLECFINPIGASEVIVEYAKLELGSVATPFSPRPYAEELAMCQRYFKVLNNSTNNYRRISIGYAPTAKTARFVIPFNQMRTLPTIPLAPIPSGFSIFSPNVPLEYVDAVPSIDSIMLNFKIPDNNTTTLTISQPILLYTESVGGTNGKIYLDAEIY